MPKLKNKLPTYRHHKASGQTVVTLNGRDVYLGRHHSSESREKYKRVVQEWLTSHGQRVSDRRRGAGQIPPRLMSSGSPFGFDSPASILR